MIVKKRRRETRMNMKQRVNLKKKVNDEIQSIDDETKRKETK